MGRSHALGEAGVGEGDDARGLLPTASNFSPAAPPLNQLAPKLPSAAGAGRGGMGEVPYYTSAAGTSV